MSIAPGTRLGPYEVVAPLGAGGMGEVYRARDARLDREVAIKVLPAEVSADADRMRRFEKEARAASALNHPNIVTVHEIGREGLTDFLVMELISGRTLRDLLLSGPLPIKKVLAIGAQIAEGLARAHEAGIVHRDLKPENVMVTREGLVKILDFGLAKRTGTSPGSEEGSHLPTETGTSPGMILGTVGYMSPEQAAGEPTDFPSDQFSFGSILYEMATGKRAFQKGNAVDTLSAIRHEEPPPISGINISAPAPFRWIVEVCLAKDPQARYASTKDLARQIANIRDHLSEAGVSPAESTSRRFRVRGTVAFAVAALAVTVASAAGLIAGRTIWKTPLATTATARQVTFRRDALMDARFAPDGQVVYAEGISFQLFSSRPGVPERRSLHLPKANLMSISTTGDLAILMGGSRHMGTLATVPLGGGGAPRELLEGVRDADWAPDGKRLAVIHVVNGKPRLEFPIGKVLYQPAEFIFGGFISPRGMRSPLPKADGSSVP